MKAFGRNFDLFKIENTKRYYVLSFLFRDNKHSISNIKRESLKYKEGDQPKPFFLQLESLITMPLQHYCAL